MTDTKKLKARMVELGFTAAQIADMLGISRQSFSLKLNNKVEFKASEITKISDVLSIKDKGPYFFC